MLYTRKNIWKNIYTSVKFSYQPQLLLKMKLFNDSLVLSEVMSYSRYVMLSSKLCSDLCNMYIRKVWLGIKANVL